MKKLSLLFVFALLLSALGLSGQAPSGYLGKTFAAGYQLNVFAVNSGSLFKSSASLGQSSKLFIQPQHQLNFERVFHHRMSVHYSYGYCSAQSGIYGLKVLDGNNQLHDIDLNEHPLSKISCHQLAVTLRHYTNGAMAPLRSYFSYGAYAGFNYVNINQKQLEEQLPSLTANQPWTYKSIHDLNQPDNQDNSLGISLGFGTQFIYWDALMLDLGLLASFDIRYLSHSKKPTDDTNIIILKNFSRHQLFKAYVGVKYLF